MAARFCPHCAAGAEADWSFCQACGRRLPAAVSGALDQRDTRIASVWVRAGRDLDAGDLDAAEQAAAALMDLGCDAGDLHALSGAIALRRANLDEAQTLLDAALAESPYSPFVRMKRAEYWFAIGMTPKAKEEVQVALRYEDAPQVREQLQKLLERLKRDARWSFARASPFDK